MKFVLEHIYILRFDFVNPVFLKLYSCCGLYLGEDASIESHSCTVKIEGGGVPCKIKERYKV